MGHTWRSFRHVIQRKRVFAPDQLETSSLKRCLTKWDLAALGLGSTLGVGVYVLLGTVALRVAGPSIVISFLVAAVAALFAGLCYAEFGARVPRAGAAYVYTYVAVGELAAFLVGWNMILEAVFGSASIARGLSVYIDSLAGGAMSAWCAAAMPIGGAFFSPHFDLCACLVVLAFAVILAAGARESATFNNLLTAINVVVILFIIIAGAFKASASNWEVPEDAAPVGAGAGGFFPFGAWGTVQGAALCFYGFVGFDAIGAAGEEVKNPRRAIPWAIVLVICVAFLAYAGVAIVVTMMVPYYALDSVGAVATAFSQVQWEWARWVVSVGACCGISASLFGAMFPLPRLLYAMASDGLLLRRLARVWPRRQTPLLATAASAAVVSVLAAVLELQQLILMVCIGTLFSYTLVAVGVILLRYQSTYIPRVRSSYVMQMLGCGERVPTKATCRIVAVSLTLFIAVCIASAATCVHAASPLVPAAGLHGAALLLLVVITVQPQEKQEVPFKTPLVPIIPCLSIYINVHLMILVSFHTWIRVIIWMLIGIPVYALWYCCYQSHENPTEDTKNETAETNGKVPFHIIVEAPTPPDSQSIKTEAESENKCEMICIQINDPSPPPDNEDAILEQAITENNEEKEAKIIDLLDQVLQAEEDSYVEEISLREDDIKTPEQEIMVPLGHNEEITTLPHRKSLSELSDAESEASLTNQDTKYSVIAQVHREDLPKVSEEEEKHNVEEKINSNDQIENLNDAKNDTAHDTSNENIIDEETVFNDSDSNSQTDEESGYSDTIDRNALTDSIEDATEEGPRIPTPPPLDEKYFNSPFLLKKSYSIPSRPTKLKPIQFEDVEENKPRESVQSNASGQSTDDGNIIFGSHRQIKFMNKLNNIFQNKITTEPENEEQRKRSNSTGDVTETIESPKLLLYERPLLFFDLKKELMNMHSNPNLRPISTEETYSKPENEESLDDTGMSREDLKSKLENIFATGGPKLLKPRLMKSNPPTPEESYQTDTSSNESIAKLPKMEKNDTLKRQKDKFGAVLDSFRLSLNKGEVV